MGGVQSRLLPRVFAARDVSATPSPVAIGDTVTAYKSPTCTCCSAWVDHLKQNRFAVVAIDTTDVDAVKQRFGVAREHAACHTAIVGGYVVEGQYAGTGHQAVTSVFAGH